MDDLTQHRKQRLQALIDGKPYFGNQSAFAQKVGLTKGRVNQLLDPKHSFGERAGLTLAESLGLKDKRYFDNKGQGEPVELPNEAERLENALVVLTDYLVKADEDTRDLVGHLLDSMAKEPRKSESKVRHILRLLVTKDDPSPESHDVHPTRHISGGLGNILDLGDKNGQSDTAAASAGGKSKK